MFGSVEYFLENKRFIRVEVTFKNTKNVKFIVISVKLEHIIIKDFKKFD